MAELPTGTVTFLFTDIEGSTALWEQHRDAMRQAQVRHDTLIEQVVAEHNGSVVRPRGEGDSRFAVFGRATDAVAAAAALQRAIYAESWPTPTPLRVRMAVHTGEADLRQGDYYGSAVNRCARLRGVAHGGQVLVSLATQELVLDAIPSRLMLRDLGEHRLKGLSRPERIYQLIIDGVPAEFPPLTTLDARPNNIPAQRDHLIGRDREVAGIIALLRRPDVGLVTLSGPGGIGKTRLSLQVAAELLDDFSDGVWFVDLAPILDPDLAASTIAQRLGLSTVVGGPIAEALKTYLHTKHLLLILDNFEQIVPAAPLVTDLLAVAPGLKVLVTSREVLRLSGEWEYAVPPLTLPVPTTTPDAVSTFGAIALFIQRAQAVNPDFQVTNENARVVAQICIRLEGLPLAIELAAVRMRMLSPQALLAHLDHRLQLLTRGARDRTARQQTLRGTIDWSYSLLDPASRRLFARLGIFVGGCTLEAVEMVCNTHADHDIDILDTLLSLGDKSLLRQQEAAGETPRFVMLDTIREYALERLAASGESDACQQRLADYTLQLAEHAAPSLVGGREQSAALDRIEVEYANIRAVLGWALEQGHTDVILRLGAALQEFWVVRGYMSEGRRWLNAGLALIAPGSGSVSDGRHVKALLVAGLLAIHQGDYAQATVQVEAAFARSQEIGDKEDIARALLYLGWVALEQDNNPRARALVEESLALFKEAEDAAGAHLAFATLGHLSLKEDDPTRAQEVLAESLTRAREQGDIGSAAQSLAGLGRVAAHQGDYAQATALLEESLLLGKQAGDHEGTAEVLLDLGRVAAVQGAHLRAHVLFDESLTLCRERRHRPGQAAALQALADLAHSQGDVVRGTALLEESLALYQELGAKESSLRVLSKLGVMARERGDERQAAALFGESLVLCSDLQHKAGTASNYYLLSVLAGQQGDYVRARCMQEESLELFRELGDEEGMAACLVGLATVASASGARERAARLLGVVEALQETVRTHPARSDYIFIEQIMAEACAQLDKAAFAVTWADGKAMTLEQAVAYVLEPDAPA